MLERIWELNQSKSHTLDNKGELDRNLAKEEIPKTGWKPLGRLPTWTRNINSSYDYSARVNRYLVYQENRILNAISRKQYQKAALIWLILLKNSFGYQMVLFNKVMPEWHYLLNYREAKLMLQKIVNKCRSNDLWLDLRRFYILKADGKRWRPIGAPDYPSRAISRSINDLIYVLFEDKFNKTQHGFRRERGAFTAIIDIVEKLKRNPKIIYEFDLKSYFNTVRPMWVYRSLLSRSPLLAEMVYKIIMQIRYKLPAECNKGEEIIYKSKYVYMLIAQPWVLLILVYMTGWLGIIIWIIELSMVLEYAGAVIGKGKNLSYKNIDKWIVWKNTKYNIIKPERELHTKTIGIDENLKPVIHKEPMIIPTKRGPIEIEAPYVIREGLPQGLSISPVLATLTMEMFKNPEELTLYADDGVYIGNNIDKFNKWKQDISLVGAEIAESKSRRVTDGKFKFLGCIIDIYKEQVIYKGKVLDWNDENFNELVKSLYIEEPYKKQPKGWTWKIKTDSVTAMNYKDMIDLWNYPIWDIIQVVWKSLIFGLPHGGYRIFRGIGIIDILGASSMACNMLVKSKSELNLVAYKPLCPIFKGKLSNYCMNKGTYYEEIYENSLRNYIKAELPAKWNNVMENYWDH